MLAIGRCDNPTNLHQPSKQVASMSAQIEPGIIWREDAESIRPFGVEMKVMMAAAQTGGTCSVLIGELKPGEGPPPHLHRDFDEYFFVLDGTISLTVDGKESTIVPGNLVFTPRGAVHSFKNIGPSTASMLEWTVPGGNEPYFRAVSEMGVNIDPKRLADINQQFATEFIGAPAGEPGRAA
jgi:quercetin dioxygenase-like cupin family protein